MTPVPGETPNDQVDWRRIAEEVRRRLSEIVSDPARAAALDKAISMELAAPERLDARIRLRRALLGDIETRQWVREALTGNRGPSLRVGDPDPDDPYRAGRYLAAEVPGSVLVEARFSIQVMVIRHRTDLPHALIRLPSGPGSRELVLTAMPGPGLRATGDLEATLTVEPHADSQPVRFGFSARVPGEHRLTVRAYLGGTRIGEIALSLEATHRPASAEARVVKSILEPVHGQAGQVTLQIHRSGDNHLFQLLGGPVLHGLESLGRPIGETTDAVQALQRYLRGLAADPASAGSAQQVREGLANRGALLWQHAVPEAIRRQFWNLAGNLGSFVIACDDDIVPWELLYAVDDAQELGFLAEHVPMTRLLLGQGGVREINVRSAAYVMPPESPTDARTEIGEIRRCFGLGIHDHGVIDQAADLQKLIRNVAVAPSVLHFACHNTFLDSAGSSVRMRDSRFRPEDLTLAAAKKTLTTAGSLVFFNACRSAGQISFFDGGLGWAQQFVRAGATAFVGTHWPVRSSSARVFAAAFYRALIEGGEPLGAATLTARRTVAADLGDPTWLAYATYGTSAATIIR